MNRFIQLGALAAILSGCASVRQSSIFQDVQVEDGEIPIEMVEIENSGWELFKFIPLASGDPERPNRLSCCWFRDTVTLQNNLNLLDMEMKARDARKFNNLTSYNTEETFLFILLTRNAYHTSALLLKDVDPKNMATEKENIK